MKRRVIKSKYGSIKFNQYGYEDLTPRKALERIPKQSIYQHLSAKSVKNNLKLAKERTSNYLLRLMWEIIVDKAMLGHSVTLPRGGDIHIGKIPGKSKTLPNLHSRGKQYNLVLATPEAHDYRIRMPRRRRLELQKRLLAGQQFANY